MLLEETVEKLREKITSQRCDTLFKIGEGINIDILGMSSFIMVYFMKHFEDDNVF